MLNDSQFRKLLNSKVYENISISVVMFGSELTTVAFSVFCFFLGYGDANGSTPRRVARCRAPRPTPCT